MWRTSLCAFALLFAATPSVSAATPRAFEQYEKCPDELLPTRLIRTTVGMQVPLKEDERPNAYTNGIGGTAWFLDKKTLVTIEHVVVAAHLSATEWRPVTFFWSDAEGGKSAHVLETRARIANVFAGDPGAEVIVALELKDVVEGAQIAKIRYAPLRQNEPIVALAYPAPDGSRALTAYATPDPDPVLRIALGNVRYPTPSEDARSDKAKEPPPYIPLDVGDRNNHRDVLNRGASGAPVFDCVGQVVATVQDYASRPMNVAAFGSLNVPPPWGQANNFAVSASSILRQKNGVAPNLILPTHEVPTAPVGVSVDDQLTTLMNAVTDAARRAVETGGGNAAELQKAWEALQAFSRTRSDGAEPSVGGLPQIQTPFQ